MDKKLLLKIMKVLFSVLFCLMFFVQSVNAQRYFTFSGNVVDGKSKEFLAGATVWATNEKIGAVANDYGYFSLKLPLGDNYIEIRHVGYEAKSLHIVIESNNQLEIELFSDIAIGEVLVQGVRESDFLLSPTFSLHRITKEKLKLIPSLMGEQDVLKVIQMLPGVSSTDEGKSSFSVRGGNPDQNLILLDGVTVYNVNHLFGYLSVFNSEILSGATLYKGGIPANFGGRLTSVLDIATKEGDMNKPKKVFSLGTLAGSIFIEGPILKEKISYALSARRTWLDLPFMLNYLGQNGGINYKFWDINAKVNWKANNQNRFFLSFYTGKDAMLNNSTGFNSTSNLDYRVYWGNITAVARWNHIFSNAMFVNTSLSYSAFRQQYINYTNLERSSYLTGKNNLSDFSLKSDFSFAISKNHRLLFGAGWSKQGISPETVSSVEKDSAIILNMDTYINPIIANFYLEDHITISPRLKANLGFRGSYYKLPTASYFHPEPRVSFSYLLTGTFSIKSSYSRMNQYLHMLNNTSIGVPVDMWVSSTNRIPPSSSDLVALGFIYQKTNRIHFSTEFYYSSSRALIRYSEGAKYLQLTGQGWENYVTTGTGESYGVEFFAEKNYGKLTGWLSYSISLSDRSFQSLNSGEKFPYEYNRRHQFKLYAHYPISEKQKEGKTVSHSMSTSFVYTSGNYMTFPTAEYQVAMLPLVENEQGFALKFIDRVNNIQLPDYHRMDVSYQIKMNKGEKSHLWNFMVYNIYNHQNVYYYYKKNGQVKQITYFPILPSVTYTRYF